MLQFLKSHVEVEHCLPSYSFKGMSVEEKGEWRMGVRGGIEEHSKVGNNGLGGPRKGYPARVPSLLPFPCLLLLFFFFMYARAFF